MAGNGIGHANSPRSHSRSMGILHTCEPDTVGLKGGWDVHYEK
jgi:hypothetical protein